MNEKSLEEIAASLQAALTEVRACLPGKERRVTVGGRDFSADDIRGFLQRMKQAEAIVEKQQAEILELRAQVDFLKDSK